ncbi:hypothetical protein ARMSODRAFT_1025191 [Armillaria solidipes]|uniref:Uncharacterized protein n=1 Tax=Armillaria solidipes TaxID=1076256 RepID=A0A2H3B7Q1_9AGAR|nr:hypothetical protein ARMSODRAFT_1025191 [Armillaria solidipes]
MAELLFQSEGSSFPQYIPSYSDSQSIGHHGFGNSVRDFNLNMPIRHNPGVPTTVQLPSHSYLHDSPDAPPFLPACGVTAMNDPLYMESAGPSKSHSEQAYFPQRPVPYYDSEPSGDLTDFGAFDYDAWFSEQPVVGSSTFTTDTVERTLVYRSTPPRGSSNLTSSRYHPYAGHKPNNQGLDECSLFRTGFDASYSASSSRHLFESINGSSESELPLLWRAFRPRVSGLCDPEDHLASEGSNTEQRDDPHSDAGTITVSPLPSDHLDEAVTQKWQEFLPSSNLLSTYTEHVVEAFVISADSAICYERDVDTDIHSCPLGCRRKFNGNSFRKHFSKFHPELNATSGNFYCTVKSHPKLMHSLKEFLCPFCLSSQRHKQDVVRHFDMCEALSGKGK